MLFSTVSNTVFMLQYLLILPCEYLREVPCIDEIDPVQPLHNQNSEGHVYRLLVRFCVLHVRFRWFSFGAFVIFTRREIEIFTRENLRFFIKLQNYQQCCDFPLFFRAKLDSAQNSG